MPPPVINEEQTNNTAATTLDAASLARRFTEPSGLMSVTHTLRPSLLVRSLRDVDGGHVHQSPSASSVVRLQSMISIESNNQAIELQTTTTTVRREQKRHPAQSERCLLSDIDAKPV
jgi:hypothetical protein